MHGFCVRFIPVISPALRRWHGFSAVPCCRLVSSRQNKPFSRFHSSVATQQHHTLLPAVKTPMTTEVEYEFTAAQLARAASQAVRVAIREGNLHIAYDVMNSMLHSPIDTRIRAPRSYLGIPTVIKFGGPLPTRLAAHSLIHCLLQEKLTLEAGRQLQRLVTSGVRFHSKTLEANVSLLCSQPSRVPQDSQFVEEPMTNPTSPWDDSEASRSLLSQTTRLNPEVHLALNILTTARQSRHRRTEWMYSRLVDACLLQGEIVVATLLFVILVKDWQLRKVMQTSPARLEEATEEGALNIGIEQAQKSFLDRGLPSLAQAKRLGLGDPKFAVPYPEKTILQSILNNINHHILSRDTQDIVRLESVESLSILADLLQQRSLPFGQIAPLLRTLQNCPSSPPYRTALLTNGYYVDVNTYNQVHKVLNQVCLEPSTTGPKPSLENPRLQPRLDLRAYNCLIHYALRHRLSPALANSVMEHMMIHRQPPLQPDSITYNTLLRASTLLHRNDIASKVLESFRQRPENSSHPISKNKLDVAPHFNAQSPKQMRMKLASFCRRIQAESITVPDFIGTPERPMLRADLYTLSSFITHLVSIGRPDMVADMIFDLLPELHVIDHPATNSPSALRWSLEQRQKRRQECIARAIEYGPYVFSALLNALRKAGETGLAERVWLLARQAERASWIPRDNPNSLAPWCLPIQAYTSVMQCYANESKKGLACIRGSRFSRGLSPSLSFREMGASWQPSRGRRGKIYVKGWAYFFLRMQAKEQGLTDLGLPLRLRTSRAVGWLLHRAMRKGAISVWQELKQVQEGHVERYTPQWTARLQSLELPVPDARFFNVVLDIFGRRFNMQKRRVRSNPSWWNRKVRIAKQLFASTGRVSSAYDHTLIEIARGMAQVGYALPLGLQRVLVGRVAHPVRKNVMRKYEVRPWAFSPRHKSDFQPFSLPCTRTRGLPLGRTRPSHLRPRRRRRRSGHREATVQSS